MRMPSGNLASPAQPHQMSGWNSLNGESQQVSTGTLMGLSYLWVHAVIIPRIKGLMIEVYATSHKKA